jgi:hypothetical protein
MKQIILILLAAAGFASCNDTGKQFKERNAGADSIAINFFKTGGNMDTVTAVKIIRNKTTIDELTAIIGASATSINDKCGFEGSIHFFKNDRVIQDVFFSSSESCRQFLFRLNGRDAATELDDTAREFLSALKSK